MECAAVAALSNLRTTGRGGSDRVLDLARDRKRGNSPALRIPHSAFRTPHSALRTCYMGRLARSESSLPLAWWIKVRSWASCSAASNTRTLSSRLVCNVGWIVPGFLLLL